MERILARYQAVSGRAVSARYKALKGRAAQAKYEGGAGIEAAARYQSGTGRVALARYQAGSERCRFLLRPFSYLTQCSRGWYLFPQNAAFTQIVFTFYIIPQNFHGNCAQLSTSVSLTSRLREREIFPRNWTHFCTAPHCTQTVFMVVCTFDFNYPHKEKYYYFEIFFLSHNFWAEITLNIRHSWQI